MTVANETKFKKCFLLIANLLRHERQLYKRKRAVALHGKQENKKILLSKISLSLFVSNKQVEKKPPHFCITSFTYIN